MLFLDLYSRTTLKLYDLPNIAANKAAELYKLAKQFKKSNPEFSESVENRFLAICDTINLDEHLILNTYINKIYKERNCPIAAQDVNHIILSILTEPLKANTDFQTMIQSKQSNKVLSR